MKPAKLITNPITSALAIVLGLILLPPVALAVPYATEVVKSGNTVTYILNQNAASVEVLRDGGNALYPGTTAGPYNFDMAGFATFQIKVTGNDAPGWSQFIPDGGASDRNFYVPLGVSIEKNPGRPNFGRVFVCNAVSGTCLAGRNTPEGIYELRADGTAAAFGNGAVAWGGGLGPFKSTIGPDGHLYVTDLSNDICYEMSPDLLSATQLIDASNKTTGQYINSIYVTGTQAGGNRSIYLVNGHYLDARVGVIKYDLAANATATTGDTGTQFIGSTPWSTYYPFDIARDSTGDWYLNTYRSSVGQASPIVKFDGTGTPPLDDDILWSASNAYAGSPYGIDINESAGIVAYARYDDGWVYIFDMATGAFKESFDAGTRGRELAFDAAGNMVTVDNTDEYARFWSPGGYTVATTTFDGTSTSFQVVRPATQVSVTAGTATVPEAGPSVNFIISRVGSTASDLTVYYEMSGTANSGLDYTTLSGSAIIPALASSVNVTLSPTEDALAELSETVILSPVANSNYSVVLPTSATISILDNETPEIAFASAAPKQLLESYAPSRVTHQLVRRGLLTPPLTVNVTYSGTATLGTDYNAPATVSIGAGAANANLVLSPINDQAYEADETATATIVAGTGYNIATPASLSATVVNDDPPPGVVLFSDDFETDSSALWRTNVWDTANGFVDFAWDYTTVGVPAAPAGGGTKGMRMQCGNTLTPPATDGLSVSPLGGNFTGDYRLRFDMWINYNGPMFDGGPGSTQNLDAGVGTSGEVVVWRDNFDADGVWFTVAGDGASGFTIGDYNAMIGNTLLNDDSGVYAAGTGAPSSGIRDASHPYYSLWGGQAAPQAQLDLYPNQSGTANIGNAGMAWHTVVITKVGDVVSWALDGITIATVTNTTLPFSTNVFVGYQDLWASATGSVSDVPAMSFGLVDNLKVLTLTAPTQPVITGISGTTLSYTSGSGPKFVLLKSASITTPLSGWSRQATNTVTPGTFTIPAVATGAPVFYIIKSE